jgi:hypothetical protein
MNRFYWSDSEVVLRWILNPNQKLVKYAIAPIEEILELTELAEWRYVPSKTNVADLCTKIQKFDFSDNSSVWITGPQFIRQAPEHWPPIPHKLKNEHYIMANNIYSEKLNYATHVLPPLNCPLAHDSAIDRLSASIRFKWTKLTRAIGRALKLHLDGFGKLVITKRWAKSEARSELNELMNGFKDVTPTDLERAEHFIFRKIQRTEFVEEYNLLLKGKRINNIMMLQLNTFMDPQGLMRINARTNLNSMDFPQQYVPLLPRKNAYVKALLEYYHHKFNHIAIESQIAEIRTKAWIPKIRTELKSVRANCYICKIRLAKAYSPPMAPLPSDRTNPDLKPFEVTGVDCLGPITVCCNNRSKKIWIIIFVCALTRFIHLHILDSLESLRVLEAIAVFWTSHGPTRKFISDNGTNFKRAAKILKEDYENSKILQRQSSILAPKLTELYRVEWQFIAPQAPWFGGMYERLIKEVKRSLTDTLQARKINRIELNIAVHEAAHRLNCRPLTGNSVDAADGVILTPHHLASTAQ